MHQLLLSIQGSPPDLSLVAVLSVELETEQHVPDNLQTRCQSLHELDRSQPLLVEPLAGQEAGHRMDLPQGHSSVVTQARINNVQGGEVLLGVDQLPLQRILVQLVMLDTFCPPPTRDQQPLYDQYQPMLSVKLV